MGRNALACQLRLGSQHGDLLLRDGMLPDVPTMAEAGVPDYDIGVWIHVAALKAPPAETLANVPKAITDISDDPATTANILNIGDASAAHAIRVRPIDPQRPRKMSADRGRVGRDHRLSPLRRGRWQTTSRPCR